MIVAGSSSAAVSSSVYSRAGWLGPAGDAADVLLGLILTVLPASLLHLYLCHDPWLCLLVAVLEVAGLLPVLVPRLGSPSSSGRIAHNSSNPPANKTQYGCTRRRYTSLHCRWPILSWPPVWIRRAVGNRWSR